MRQADQISQGNDALYRLGDPIDGGDQLQGDPGEPLQQRVVNVAREPGALLEHRGEAGLERTLPGSPQRAFRALALGDVHDHADVLVYRPGPVEHRLTSEVDVADRAVGPNDPGIHLKVAPVAHGILDRPLD